MPDSNRFGAIARAVARRPLIALAAVAVALRVHAGLKVHYDSPYTLMAVMGTNINVTMLTGGLLLVAYVAWIVWLALQ